jgi:hypothetical protein
MNGVDRKEQVAHTGKNNYIFISYCNSVHNKVMRGVDRQQQVSHTGKK